MMHYDKGYRRPNRNFSWRMSFLLIRWREKSFRCHFSPLSYSDSRLWYLCWKIFMWKKYIIMGSHTTPISDHSHTVIVKNRRNKKRWKISLGHFPLKISILRDFVVRPLMLVCRKKNKIMRRKITAREPRLHEPVKHGEKPIVTAHASNVPGRGNGGQRGGEGGQNCGVSQLAPPQYSATLHTSEQ